MTDPHLTMTRAWAAVPLLREPDPLDHAVGPGSTWTTVNAAEALPGVLTPLGASAWIAGSEVGIRRCFHELGVLARSEVRLPDDADQRFSGVLVGRYAANLDRLRAVADRTPGTSGDALERQAFGSVRPGVPASRASVGRYPAIVVNAPRSVLRLRRRMRTQAAALDAWWRDRTREEIDDVALARRRFDEGLRGFTDAMAPHFMATMVVQGLLDRLRDVCDAAGLPGHELLVAGGGEELEEERLVARLLQVAAGRLDLDAVVTEFGFQGPDVGEIAGRPWREDRAPLEAMVTAYGRLSDGRGGTRAPGRGDGARRDDALRELLAAVPRTRRPLVALLSRTSAAMLPLREVGKGSFLRALDVSRHAARAAGRLLAADGALDDPEDVFLLRTDELLHGPPAGVRDLVAARRAQRERYAGLRLPELWTGPTAGIPADAPSTGAPDARDALQGIGASPGRVTARARVVERAVDCDRLEPGEVLVAAVTDPSWAAAFPLASALVTDIGGAVSHAAIVAREMGLPCVVNTGAATRSIRTGDLLVVDGTTGEVTVAERAHIDVSTPAPDEDPTMTDGTTPAPSSTSDVDPDALAVLRLVGLKGRTAREVLCEALGRPTADVDAVLDPAIAAGDVKEARGTVRLTPEGRERLTALLAEERAGVDGARIAAAYERFHAPNTRLKELMTRWQTRDGGPNDHTDADYDGAIAAELATLHDDVRDLIAEIAAAAPRLTPYVTRLQRAADAVAAGDHAYFAKPLLDSYHTVWFELHEELIDLLGLSREDEARAGRAV
ncbi:MAG: PEP-utilizing enzyme [Solirubrobacteraceae bacterium]|nr:PEP-utilizing enzyme [Solirubrobacteraceae bacterium]